MSTTVYGRRPDPGTQPAIILQILENEPGRWIGLDYLMHQARSGAVHSVIATLRTRYGLDIENRQTIQRGTRRRVSCYRLNPTSQTTR